MDKVEALEALLEKVRNGEADEAQGVAKQIASAARDNGNTFPHHLVMKAYSGSLDAALAMHNAVLPEWLARTSAGGASAGIKFWSCDLEHWETGDEVGAWNQPIPARAWLIAILKALIDNERTSAQRGGDAQPAAGNTHTGEAVK